MNGAGWSGYIYDGHTADRRNVRVSLDATGILIRFDDGQSSHWPIADVRQTQGSFSSELLRLEYGTDPVQALFVDDRGFAKTLRAVFPESRLRWRATPSTVRLLVWTAGIMGSLVVLYVFGANTVSDWLARRAPLGWERALGRSVAEGMAPVQRRCIDSSGSAAINGIVQRLVGREGSPYDFRVVVLRDSIVNAFAAPGGFIAVNQGLIARARTPDELAGVLAHEAQHVLHRHSTRGIIREAPLRIAINVLFGGSGLEHVASFAGSLGSLSYRRGDEAEADRDGMRLMLAAEMDGRAMVSFMETLAKETRDTPRLISYMTSHPYTPDRVAQLRGLLPSTTTPASPALDEASWARVKAMCGARGGGPGM